MARRVYDAVEEERVTRGHEGVRELFQDLYGARFIEAEWAEHRQIERERPLDVANGQIHVTNRAHQALLSSPKALTLRALSDQRGEPMLDARPSQ